MRKLLPRFLFILSVSVICFSCEKGEEAFPGVKPTEKTLVQLPDAADGPLFTIALDLTPGVQTLNVLKIQRDAISPADLNRTLTVKIKNQNAAIADPSSGEVTELPRNLYTNHPDNPFDGQYWTVTFKPGEFVKYLKINMDAATLITLGERVGLGFQIAEASGAQISDSKFQLGVEISAKNPWDGIYSYTGSLVHPTACISGPIGTSTTGGPLEIALITTGPNTVKRSLLGIENFIFWDNCNSGFGYFTNVIPAYQINANNSVTILSRPGNTVTWVESTPLNYNPATKTFTLTYGYLSTPNREITEKMVYLRSR